MEEFFYLYIFDSQIRSNRGHITRFVLPKFSEFVLNTLDTQLHPFFFLLVRKKGDILCCHLPALLKQIPIKQIGYIRKQYTQ